MVKDTNITDYIKQARHGLICLGVAIVILIGNMIISSVYYVPTKIKYVDAKQNVAADVERAKVNNQQSNVNVSKKATGLDAERVKTDDIIIEKFLKKCLSWKSYDEFKAIREEITESYNFAKDSNFMSVMFPNIEVTDKDGNVYNRIDVESLNMSYDSLKSYVTNISNGVYTYFTEVTVTSTADDNTSSGMIVCTYSIDEDGNMMNIDAFTIAS